MALPGFARETLYIRRFCPHTVVWRVWITGGYGAVNGDRSKLGRGSSCCCVGNNNDKKSSDFNFSCIMTYTWVAVGCGTVPKYGAWAGVDPGRSGAPQTEGRHSL